MSQTPQAQKDQIPEPLPEHVRKFIEEYVMDLEDVYIRKCVDSDFVDALVAVLLGDDTRLSYRTYAVAGSWYVLHIWYPGTGGDWAVVAKIDTGDIEECWVIET